MRKRYRIVLLAAVIAALVVPLGFALSFESTPTPARDARLAPPVAMTMVDPSLAAAPGGATFLHTMPDAAKLLGVGTVLFGLAAALRRAA